MAIISADDYEIPSHQRLPKSYTLVEIETLVREYLQEIPLTDKITPELVLSSVMIWLKKREKVDA